MNCRHGAEDGDGCWLCMLEGEGKISPDEKIKTYDEYGPQPEFVGDEPQSYGDWSG